MKRTRLTILISFWGYAALTGYMLARSVLGQPFQLWTGFVQPVFALVFVISHATERLGRKHAALFAVIVVGITLGMETVGVATGWPFGPYHYTRQLGPVFGSVPVLIPIVWLNMLYPAFTVAEKALPTGWRGWQYWLGAASSGAAAMTAWDLVVDPVMTSRGHWVWEVQGAYFGIPVQNFAGWWLTAFLALGLFLGLSRGRAATTRGDSGTLPVWLYGLAGLSMMVSAMRADLLGPVAASLCAMFPWFWIGLLKR